MPGFQEALEQAISHVKAFNQIIDNRVENADKLFSDTTRFLEASKNITTMLEATGAEIEGNGKANKTTVLGKKRGLGGRRKTGASLLDYYREKISLIKEMHGVLVNIATTMSAEQHLNNSMGHDLGDELAGIQEQEARQEDRKLKKLATLLTKSEKRLGAEEKLNERDEKTIAKEERLYNTAYKDVLNQAKRLKRLTRAYAAKRSYNHIALYERRERKAVLRIIKNQARFLKTFSDDTKDLIRFLDDFLKELKALGEDVGGVKELIEKLRKDSKHLKKLEKLERKEKKFEKHVPKLDRIRETDESEDADELEEDITKEDESIKEMEQEEEDIRGIMGSLREVDDYLKGLMGRGARMANTFDYHLSYVTQSLLSAKKMLKKNPTQVKDFLRRVAKYAEEHLPDDLRGEREEEERLRSGFEDGERMIETLSEDAERLITQSDKTLHAYLKDLDKGVSRIGKDLGAAYAAQRKALQKQEKEEEDAKKSDKKLRKRASKTGLETDRTETKDMKRQERNIQAEMDENARRAEKLEGDLQAYRKALEHAQASLPSLKELQKKLLPKKRFRKLAKSVEKHLSSHKDHWLSRAEQDYGQWSTDPLRVSSYVELINDLGRKTLEDLDMLRALENIHRGFNSNAEDLHEFFRYLEAAIAAFEEVNRTLGNFEQDVKEHLEHGEELFGKTRAVYEDFNEELKEIKALEPSLAALSQEDGALTQAVEEYLDSVQSFYEHIMDVNKKLGKEKDWEEGMRPQGIEALKQAA